MRRTRKLTKGRSGHLLAFLLPQRKDRSITQSSRHRMTRERGFNPEGVRCPSR